VAKYLPDLLFARLLIERNSTSFYAFQAELNTFRSRSAAGQMLALENKHFGRRLNPTRLALAMEARLVDLVNSN
jgi:hypothetical protein